VDRPAGIAIYCLSLSNALDLDTGWTMPDKLELNGHQYLVDLFYGRFRRPEREKHSGG
jgi:hypothetical protein